MGPMAEDFRKAFGLGKDDNTIFNIDAAGTAMSAIKALAIKVDRLESKNRQAKRNG
jgi:hypothetical protein